MLFKTVFFQVLGAWMLKRWKRLCHIPDSLTLFYVTKPTTTFIELGSINSWAKWWTAKSHVALNIHLIIRTCLTQYRVNYFLRTHVKLRDYILICVMDKHKPCTYWKIKSCYAFVRLTRLALRVGCKVFIKEKFYAFILFHFSILCLTEK